LKSWIHPDPTQIHPAPTPIQLGSPQPAPRATTLRASSLTIPMHSCLSRLTRLFGNADDQSRNHGKGAKNSARSGPSRLDSGGKEQPRGTHNSSYRRNSNRHSSSPRKNASAPMSRASLRILCTPVPRNSRKCRGRSRPRIMFLRPRLPSGRMNRVYSHRETQEIRQSRPERTNGPWRQISIQLAGNHISSMKVQFSTPS